MKRYILLCTFAAGFGLASAQTPPAPLLDPNPSVSARQAAAVLEIEQTLASLRFVATVSMQRIDQIIAHNRSGLSPEQVQAAYGADKLASLAQFQALIAQALIAQAMTTYAPTPSPTP